MVDFTQICMYSPTVPVSIIFVAVIVPYSLLDTNLQIILALCFCLS